MIVNKLVSFTSLAGMILANATKNFDSRKAPGDNTISELKGAIDIFERKLPQGELDAVDNGVLLGVLTKLNLGSETTTSYQARTDCNKLFEDLTRIFRAHNG